MADPYPVSEKLRTTLRGFPAATIAACAEFEATGDRAALDRAVLALVEHHLSPPPPRPLSTYPGSTKLVAELGLDSITMVELVFLFEDLFGAKLPQDKLVAVVTIDDLRALVQAQLPPRVAS
ncbi:MAG: acyl carrier protein [Verrucomicrobia bacterium]|jgi:aryl carrier-like protein|nr:acyl carrier protein [Verrucomicrobiota bacterium]